MVTSPTSPTSRFAPQNATQHNYQCRPREFDVSSATTVPAADVELPVWVAALTHKDAQLVDNAISQLCDHTMWQETNQREVAELGGPSLLVELIKSRLRFIQGSSVSLASADQDADVQAVVKALTVLMQLSANDDLTARIAAIPGCVSLLVGLLSHAHRPIVVHAARCLINLTHSSTEAQAAALQAGALDKTFSLLFCGGPDNMPPPPASDVTYAASCKLACWLLANLTASFGSPARQMILARQSVVERVVHLASPGASQGPVTLIASNVLRNLARTGPAAQTQLASQGALSRLASHLAPNGSQPPESLVLAAVLGALSALVMDHAANTAALVATPGLGNQLGLILETRHSAFESDADDASVVLAAHCLVHVLGHMLVNSATGSKPLVPGMLPHDSSGSRQVLPQALLERDMVDGRASVLVPSESGSAAEGAQSSVQGQQAVYISLSASARASGVELPVQTRLQPKDGSSTLTPIEAAELRHQMSHVLLPKLRSPNHHMAATAAACVYHLAAACGGPAANEARQLMADGALVSELLAGCRTGDPELAHACLMVLDVLSAEPLCVDVMLASDWLASVVPLLQSEDALVRRFAERALCSLYIATGGGQTATCCSS